MDSKAPLLLRDCLEAATWRRLLAIMGSHGLPCSTRWSKGDLVKALHEHLSNEETLRDIVVSLPDASYQALRTLAQAGGALPLRTFTATFGEIRPYRPWRKESSERAPWERPVSAVEELWYLGLVYIEPARPAPGAIQHIVVPRDLLDHSARILLAPQTGAVRVLPRPGRPPVLLWQAAILTATFNEHEGERRSRRWLSPRLLAALVGRMGLDRDRGFQLPRSERQIAYIAFLHFLIEAAGLVPAGTDFGVTPAGWDWLAADPPARLRRLWQAWLDAEPSAEAPFRFPWSAWSPEARRMVLAQLRSLSLVEWVPLATLVAQVRLQDAAYCVPAVGADDDADPIAALVRGPLFWLGLVDLAVGQAGADEALLRLTPLGAWLLELPAYEAFPTHAPEPCCMRPPDHEIVVVPPGALPVHLARLASICEWQPPAFPDPAQRLQLSAERIGMAAARGLELAQMLHWLETALGRPPGRRLQQRIREWAAAGRRVRIRRLTVLETDDARLMGRLRGKKLIRRHLGDALSPTRSELDPAGLPSLVQTLRTLQLYAAVPAAPASPRPAGPSPGVLLSEAEAGFLLAAAKVYAGLGAYVALPIPPASHSVDAVAGQLSAEQQQAADLAARRVLEQIAASLQGYLALPSWHLETDSAEIQPRIESAIAKAHDLIVTYHGAARGESITRRITPYWIEKRHGVLYLMAYCHLREDERLFRLDRILRCETYQGSSSAEDSGSARDDS